MTEDAPTPLGFAALAGCIYAVEIHDHLPQQSSLERAEFQRRMARKQINNRRNANKNRKRDHIPK